MAKTIGHVNIRGLRANRAELIQFLNDHNIDILSLNETFLGNDTPPSFPGYTIISQPRPGPVGRGGVALLVKQNILHDVLHKNHIPNEHITIRVTTSNNLPFTITTIYCPDQNSPPHQDIFSSVTDRYTRNLFLGDFNAKHPDFGHTNPNRNGHILSEIAQNFDLILLNDDSPTYISPTGTPSTLDLALCSPPLAPTLRNFQVIYELSSDHYPFLLSTTTDIATSAPGPHTIRNRKNYNKTNWQDYANELDLSLPPDPPLNTCNDVDNLVTALTDAIKASLHSHTPDSRPRPPNKDYLLPPHIIQRIRYKNRLRKEFQRTRNPATKRHINRLTNETRREMKQFQAQRWNEACSLINDNTPPHERWRVFKRLTGRAKKPPYPTLVSGATTARTDQEKATLLNQTMDNTQRDINDPHFDRQTKLHINRTIAQNADTLNPLPHLHPDPDPPDDLTTPFTPLEIYIALRSTKNTTPGTDSIPFRAIKRGPPSLLNLLARLFTTCLQLGYFPTDWKIARLCMIPKPNKDVTNPKNYRPISLLSTLGKTLERVIKNRLYPYLEETHFFNDHQSGFRSKRSTTDQLLYYSQTVYEGFNLQKTTSSAFLDVEKAFDAVWHNGIRFKLLQLDIPIPYKRILSNFLNDRTVFTEINGYRSPPYTPQAGVPQGSVLSPLLFITYMNDLPAPHRHIRLSQFADDIAIWTTSKDPALATQRLQNYLDTLQNYCNNWRIRLNPQKTVFLIHHRRRRPLPNPPTIYIRNHPIQPSPTAKFLGLTLNTNLNWNPHFTDIINRAKFRISLLRRVVARGRGSDPQTNVRIYRQFIRPLFEYGCPATITLNKSTLNKLQSLQNTALTTALHLPRTTSHAYTHNLTNSPLIETRLQTLAENYIHPDRIRNKSKIRKRLRALRRHPPQPPTHPPPLSVIIDHL